MGASEEQGGSWLLFKGLGFWGLGFRVRVPLHGLGFWGLRDEGPGKGRVPLRGNIRVTKGRFWGFFWITKGHEVGVP